MDSGVSCCVCPLGVYKEKVRGANFDVTKSVSNVIVKDVRTEPWWRRKDF